MVASPVPVFAFSVQIDDAGDNETLTVTATNLTATTQFMERARMSEKQRRQADKCMTQVREIFTLKKVIQGQQKIQGIKQHLIPAINSSLDRRYQSLQEQVIEAIRVADRSTWHLGDPKYWFEPWPITLVLHSVTTISTWNLLLKN